MGLSSSEIGCVVLIMLLLCISKSYAQTKVFDIMQFGAKPDGVTDNSQALSKAWSKACGCIEGGVVLIPASGSFLVVPLNLQGPCKGSIHIQIDGELLASADKQFSTGDHWLHIAKVDNLSIDGCGRMNGQGSSAWSSKTHNRPVTLRLNSINTAIVKNIRSEDSKFFHFAVHESHDVTFDNVTVIAPANSPNTDGIHISLSSGINIMNSMISTGDDCISLGPGSKFITITNVQCGPGHGISIGSLGKNANEDDVSGVTVRDSTISGTTNGVRIKSWPTSYSSEVSKITFLNLQMNNVKNPILIDQNYCPHQSCKYPTEMNHSGVQIRDVRYEGITGTSTTDLAVNFECSQAFPCKDIVLKDINLALSDGGSATASCHNVHGSASGQQFPPSCLNSYSPSKLERKKKNFFLNI